MQDGSHEIYSLLNIDLHKIIIIKIILIYIKSFFFNQ